MNEPGKRPSLRLSLNLGRAALLAVATVSLLGCPEPTPTVGQDVPDAAAQDVDTSVGTDGDVTIAGDDGGPIDTGENNAPELARVGDRIVAVGDQLVIVLEATDVDNDALTYSVFGTLPEGAKFDKTFRRFEWTPTVAGGVTLLSFVVSDGEAFDRETVRVEVVTEGEAHPPKLQPIGAQTVVAEKAFELQLVATDPDGQPLTYGFSGTVPGKPKLDEDSGLFTWTPAAKVIGDTFRVTFTVSDGGLSATEEVDLIVTDGTTGGTTPVPPVFADVSAQEATVGEALNFTLSATDANPDDTLVFAIFNGAPAGATLNGPDFSWTPAAADASTGWEIIFSVTDGVFTTYGTVSVNVGAASVGQCTDDPDEPNESIDEATLITPGTIERSLCDSDLVPLDDDFYAVELLAGDSLEVTLTFEHSEGDLDLMLMTAAEEVLAASEGLTDTEALSWTTEAAATLYIFVGGVNQPAFASAYSLTVAVDSNGSACVDDDLEPNDDIVDAKPLPASSQQLEICPGNKDYFTTQLGCGQDVTVTMDTMGTGDLDFALYPAGSTTSVASGATENAVEVGTAEDLAAAGTYSVVVVGYPAATGSGSYTLSVEATGGCADDSLAGSDASGAFELLESDGSLDELRLCCANDWFVISVPAGDTLIVDVGSAAGSVGVTIRDDGGAQLASEPPAAGGQILELNPAPGGNVFVEVTGVSGSQYGLSWLTEASSTDPCDALSCPKLNVCDTDTGNCVSDFCTLDSDCPTGHGCHETYCSNPCSTGSECRDDYACKAFADGLFCGITGESPAGGPCFTHTTCDGTAVCHFKEADGYCAELGCLENEDVVCPTGTSCTLDADDNSLCGLSCDTSSDCRTEDGFACAPPEDTCLPL